MWYALGVVAFVNVAFVVWGTLHQRNKHRARAGQ